MELTILGKTPMTYLNVGNIISNDKLQSYGYSINLNQIYLRLELSEIEIPINTEFRLEFTNSDITQSVVSFERLKLIEVLLYGKQINETPKGIRVACKFEAEEKLIRCINMGYACLKEANIRLYPLGITPQENRDKIQSKLNDLVGETETEASDSN